MKRNILFLGKILSVAIKICLFVCVGFNLQAQSTSSTITGFVSDGQESVHEAVVTAIHIPTNTAFYAITTAKGHFVIHNVTAGGPYCIIAEKMGYKTTKVEEVYAPIGETISVDIVVDKTAITLSEVAIYKDKEGVVQRSGAAIHLERKILEDIPTANRNINDVLRLAPQGAIMGSGLAVGGGTYRSSAITIDGATANNVFGSGANFPGGGSPIALDAIDQITINITPFDIRNSGFMGSAINIVTKRGGNQWQGTVYDYFASNNLRGTQVYGDEIANGQVLNNVTGITLSGPVVKDKLFFFVNAEYALDNVAGSNRQARSNEQSMWGGSTIFNRPTLTQMNEISRFLTENFNYDPGNYQDYTLNTPDYKLLARLDWNINKNNNLSVRFSHTHTYSSSAPSSSMSPIGGTNTTVNIDGTSYSFNRYAAGRESEYALYFESARYYQVLDFTSLVAELNSRILNGKASNLARVTWSYQNEPRSFEGDVFPTVDILEPYADANGNTQYAMFTTFGIDPFSYQNLRRVHTLNATDEVSFSYGMHNFLAGMQFEFNRIVNGYMQGGAGWYLFDSWESFAQGHDPLSFMITHANNDDPTVTHYPSFDFNQASVYFQDAMDITKNFKLMAGIRLETPFITLPYNNHNIDFSNVAQANPNSSFAGLSTDDLPKVTANVSPRIGFNWDVLRNHKLRFRGGTGLYTGRIPNTWLISAISNSNCLQYQYIANQNNNNSVIPFYPNREEIIQNLYAQSSFQQQDLEAPTATTILAKDLHMPTSWKSSLAFDVRLPYDIKGTIEGIYSYNFNEIVASTLGYSAGDSIQLPGEPNQRTSYYSENITNKRGVEMRGYYLHNAKNMHGQYLSLTAQLSKRFKWGLDLMAAYTHSFSTAVSDAGGDQVNNIAQVCNVHGDNGPEIGYTAFVTPNRVVAYAGFTIQQRERAATKIGIFYEGYHTCFVNANFNQARYSYTMTTDTNTRINAAQLIYIPTREELENMPFISDENRAAYESFISKDKYLSKHRGEYSRRNGAVTPWLNRINLNIRRELYLNVNDRKTTLVIGADFNNIANLLYSNWGVYQKLSSENILEYKNGKYAFTKPTWSNFNDFKSTWSILLHLRYSF